MTINHYNLCLVCPHSHVPRIVANAAPTFFIVMFLKVFLFSYVPIEIIVTRLFCTVRYEAADVVCAAL